MLSEGPLKYLSGIKVADFDDEEDKVDDAVEADEERDLDDRRLPEPCPGDGCSPWPQE